MMRCLFIGFLKCGCREALPATFLLELISAPVPGKWIYHTKAALVTAVLCAMLLKSGVLSEIVFCDACQGREDDLGVVILIEGGFSLFCLSTVVLVLKT
jgi:hypothetical protein